jgi:peptidylprolyl isomerase
MKRFLYILSVLIFMHNTVANAAGAPSNTLLMHLKDGEVVIQLYPDKAPEHVKRITELTNEGFYNGLKFHRVIAGFMVQTGDPKGDGTGGSNKSNLRAEFNDIKHTKGVLSMARSADPNSANSQFFIMLGDSPHLDGQYTAFGRVISGMEFVDKIKKGDPNRNGSVENPDTILEMTAVPAAAQQQ